MHLDGGPSSPGPGRKPDAFEDPSTDQFRALALPGSLLSKKAASAAAEALDGVYTLENVNAVGKYLNVDGSRVQIRGNPGSSSAQWKMVSTFLSMCGGIDGVYTLENVDAKGNYLEAADKRTSRGGDVQISGNPHSPWAQWKISCSDGVYTLENLKAKGKYLDVEYMSTMDFAGVQIFDNPRSLSTQWRLAKVSSSLGATSLSMDVRDHKLYDDPGTKAGLRGGPSSPGPGRKPDAVKDPGTDQFRVLGVPGSLLSKKAASAAAEALDGVYTSENVNAVGKYLNVDGSRVHIRGNPGPPSSLGATQQHGIIEAQAQAQVPKPPAVLKAAPAAGGLAAAHYVALPNTPALPKAAGGLVPKVSGFEASNFNKAYGKVDTPEFQHEVFAALMDFLRAMAVKEGADEKVAKDMFKNLQNEILTRPAFAWLQEVQKLALILWTSAIKGICNKEFCNLLNEAIYEDEPGPAFDAALILVRTMNSLIVTREKSIKLEWPPGWTSYRGSGLPMPELLKFVRGEMYRAALFLATAFKKRVAIDFLKRVPQHLVPVLFIFKLDEDYTCDHALYLGNLSLVEGEGEFLYSPYSAFTVLSIKIPAAPAWSDPAIVELRVAPNNQTVPANLRVQKWH